MFGHGVCLCAPPMCTSRRSQLLLHRSKIAPFSRVEKNLLSTYSKILFRFNFLRLPYLSYSPFHVTFGVVLKSPYDTHGE